MDKYSARYHLDNGEVISALEVEASSYNEALDLFYKEDESGMVSVEQSAEKLFIPISKISYVRIINISQDRRNLEESASDWE